ncbi:MAG: hypothetical protein ACI4OZ_10110 [Akkermansia sp.]
MSGKIEETMTVKQLAQSELWKGHPQLRQGLNGVYMALRAGWLRGYRAGNGRIVISAEEAEDDVRAFLFGGNGRGLSAKAKSKLVFVKA